MRRFEELQALVAVVETGSFTAAADRLDMAKSAVSRRVAALEERLGVQLLMLFLLTPVEQACKHIHTVYKYKRKFKELSATGFMACHGNSNIRSRPPCP